MLTRIWQSLVLSNKETDGGLVAVLVAGLLVGLVYGLVAGLATGLVAGLVVGLVWLVFGLVVGLAVGLAGISGGAIGVMIAFGITALGWWMAPILGGLGLGGWSVAKLIRRSKADQPKVAVRPPLTEVSRPPALPETISQALDTIRAFLESAERLPPELRGDASILIERAQEFLAGRAKHLLDQHRVLSARQRQLEPEPETSRADIRSLDTGRVSRQLKDIEVEFAGAAETTLDGWQELLEAEKRMGKADQAQTLAAFAEALEITREMLEASGYRETIDELAEEIKALEESQVTPLDPSRQLPKAASGSSD